MPVCWIGTSGWSYKDWRGPFYPPKLPASQWFPFFCQHFPTVELNVTFYRIPTENAVTHWAEIAPPGFIFAAKLFREITHLRRFHNCDELLDRYFAVMNLLGDRLPVILIQLPPSFRYQAEVAEQFFTQLRQRDPHRRYVIECRHESWFRDEAYDQLRRHEISFCIADWGQPFPPWEIVTAPFLYVRFHGPTIRYASKYSDEDLATAAAKIRDWLARGLDIYVYFNNDTHGYAIENANTLRSLIRI